MSSPTARLLVVTGKGGVGRSTIAAGIAQRAVADGKAVLAVDAVAAGGLAMALGHAGGITPGEMVEVGPAGPTLLELDTEASLDEFVRLNLRSPISTRSLGPIAKIFEYVATAAPAVREILTIGKIGHEVRRQAWDLVVVDGPATGHVVELLSSPATLQELVGFGPLVAETGWIAELLADREQTAVIVVAIPEELPISESLQLLARLEAETDVGIGALVVNRMPPPVGTAGEREAQGFIDGKHPLAPLVAVAVDRSDRAAGQRRRLDGVTIPIIEVPERVHDPVAAVTNALAAAPIL